MDGKEKKCHKLFEFCASGDRIGLADYIISSGCNPSAYDTRDSVGKTALHIACRHGHLDTVRALIEVFGCSLTTKDINGDLPVHEACSCGHLEIVDYLFSLSPSSENDEKVFTADSDGNNLLHKACQSGSVALVRYLRQTLIASSSSFPSRKLNLYLDSVATYSANENHSRGLVQCVSTQNHYGDTPLHIACRHGHLDVLRVFGTLLPSYGHLKSLTVVASQCNYYNIVSYLIHQNQQKKDVLDFDSESRQYIVVEQTPHDDHRRLQHLGYNVHHNTRSGRYFPHRYDKCEECGELCGICHSCINYMPLGAKYRMKCKECNERGLSPHRLSCSICGSSGEQTPHDDHRRLQHLGYNVHHNTSSGRLQRYDKCEECGKLCGICHSCTNYMLLGAKYRMKCKECNEGGLAPPRLSCSICGSSDMHIDTSMYQKPFSSEISPFRVRSDFSDSALHTAAQCGNFKLFNSLLALMSTTDITILHAACASDNVPLVTQVIETFKCDYNHPDSRGNTPLHVTCKWGSYKVATLLTSLEGIKVDTRNLQQETPLHLACKYNRLELCKLLIMKGSRSAHGSAEEVEEEQTPLHLACCHDSIELVEAVLENADATSLIINRKDMYGDSPMFNACRHGNLQIVKLLIQKGSNPFFLNEQTKETPVHIACRTGRLDLLSALLQGNTDTKVLNQKNVFGATPIHLALERNCVEMIQFLIEFDHHVVNKELNTNKLTLAHFACCREQVEIIRYILQFSIKLNMQDKDGNTPLHIACLRNNVEIVKLLVDRCSITIRNIQLKTPVHIATEKQNLDLAKCLLLGYSESLDSYVDCNGDTALHIACRNQFLEAVSLLTKHCSVTLQNEKKQTPLHVACRTKRADVIRQLLLTCPESIDSYPDQSQDTVLHCAVNSRSLATVELVLPHSSPTCQNKTSMTPIHIACRNADLEIVRVLTAKCSSVVLTNEGNTYLHSACSSTDSLPLVKFLLEESGLKPVDLLTQNSEGDTPLHVACSAGVFDTISYLIAFPEFDPHVCNTNGCFPLHCALSASHFETVKKIISEKLVDPDTQCIKGEPLLHSLMKHNVASSFLELATFLISGKYCTPSVCDSDGNSILHCLVRYMFRIPFVSIVRILNFLLSRPDINVNIQNTDGNTALHLLCSVKKHIYEAKKKVLSAMLVQLLSHQSIKSSLVARNKKQKTPIQLANSYPVIRLLISYGANPQDVYTEFSDILDKFKQQHPLNPAMKIIVLGNSEAGKTTLVNALKLMDTSSENISSVGGPTAGVATSEHSSKDLGRVIFHDFAGQPEYESGNSAFLENCFHSATGAQPPIFLLLVDSSKRSSLERNAKYWFSYIKNHSPQQLETPPHVIVVGSHMDRVNTAEHGNIERSIKAALNCVHSSKFNVFGPILLDCRGIASEQLKTLKRNISDSCSSLRVSVNVDCRCHILFAYLSKWFKGKPAIKLNEVQEKVKSETLPMQLREVAWYPGFRRRGVRAVTNQIVYPNHATASHTHYDPRGYNTYGVHGRSLSLAQRTYQTDILLPFKKETLLELIQSLHSGGHLLLLNAENVERDCWIVLENDSLFTQVNGTLFAPENFNLPKLPTNTGVVSVEMLHSLFKKLDIDLVTEYLVYSEFCQKIEDPETLDLIKRGCSETADSLEESDKPDPDKIEVNDHLASERALPTTSEAKQYYFFPALVKSDRPSCVWETSEHYNYTYSFGWYLMCNRNHFLDPRFLHVLLLRLTFNFAAASKSSTQENLRRMCTIWKNGIQWCTRTGVEVLLEVVEQNTAVLLLLRCVKDQEMEGVKLRSEVIRKVLDTKEQFCPNAETSEYLLPPCSVYPDVSNHDHMIHVSEIAQAISNGEPCIIDSKYQPLPLRTLLFFDSYLQIGQKSIKTLWNEEKCDEEVESTFLLELSTSLSTFLKQVTQILDVPQTEVDLHKEQWKDNPTYLLHHIFESWKIRQTNASYQTLRELFNSYSMFCGRNPLVSHC